MPRRADRREHGGDRAALEPEAWQRVPVDSREAISDSVRRRVLEIAAAIADRELADPSLWDSSDWRDTCDRAAGVINAGGTPKLDEVL